MGETEKKIRCSIGAPKKKFGAPIWCGWTLGLWNGSKLGEPKKNFGAILGLPKGTEKNFRFTLFLEFLTGMCLFD